jgi:sulfite reductase beta subunit
MADVQERRTDYGPPHYEQFLPPIIKENYGKWKYHEILTPDCTRSELLRAG